MMMNTIPTFAKPWFRMLPDTVEKINDADDFGVAEKALVVEMPAERNAVSTFLSASGIKAFSEPESRIIIRGMGHRMIETRVSLPFVSIQHREG